MRELQMDVFEIAALKLDFEIERLEAENSCLREALWQKQQQAERFDFAVLLLLPD
jgi:hypothetical protein